MYVEGKREIELFDTSLPDPTDLEYLDRPSGRGLLLMRAFMDEVRYNPIGNRVALVKRRDICEDTLADS